MRTRVEMLKEMGVPSEDAQQHMDEPEQTLPEHGIAESKERLAHIFAQILHESGSIRYDTGNLHCSAKALHAAFGTYFKADAQAEVYARNPGKIANRI